MDALTILLVLATGLAIAAQIEAQGRSLVAWAAVVGFGALAMNAAGII
jgi:hypothetical protein